jgi:hypothetical protein
MRAPGAIIGLVIDRSHLNAADVVKLVDTLS